MEDFLHVYGSLLLGYYITNMGHDQVGACQWMLRFTPPLRLDENVNSSGEDDRMNKPIVTALAAIGLAQFLKVPIQKVKTGEWDWKTAFESGGMPSSHSAGVTSLATYIALKRGMPTIDFALSTVFGLIVMYDAQGIRRQTGEITLKVNELDEEVEKLQGEHNPVKHQIKEERLKEMLGHQPEEVLGGALFGMICGAIGYSLSKNKK